eukprot:scaffold205345_cov21-Tisochrysis_lutea.AAC.2
MGKWAISVFQKGSRRLEEPGPMWTGPSWELMVRNVLFTPGFVWYKVSQGGPKGYSMDKF